MALGKRVKERREELGITQAALAEKIGKAQSYIQSFEARDSQKTNNSEEIANALQVDHFWLLTGKTVKTYPATISSSSSEPLDGLDSVAVEFALGVLDLAREDPEFDDNYFSMEWRIRVFQKMYNHRLTLDEAPSASDIRPLLRLVS